MKQSFKSKHYIGDQVQFEPNNNQNLVASETKTGSIVAVRFTKAKVFYDICDDYYGIIFSEVDSSNVYPINERFPND